MQHVWAPGRVNLIGEHIDYHLLPVLPMALKQRIEVGFAPRNDALIEVASEGYGERRFEWSDSLEPVGAGDWENYVRAAALAVARQWGVGRGIEAQVKSNLPAAAGLSSSSALIAAFALALLRANGWRASFEELMQALPEGEQFVGTRGGGMDHAAVLASRAGHASLVSFRPVSVRHVPVPDDWVFLVIDSGVRAEKSGAARERYNSVRNSPRAAAHVASESARVAEAVAAMEARDAEAFGRLLLESHASLRDRLQASHPELDRIVECAIASGALGARLTGAGFGGSVVALCLRERASAVRRSLSSRWNVFEAEAGDGAMADALHSIQPPPRTTSPA
jgi:galactokinase